MQVSTSTLLTVANNVLLSVNERPLPNLTNLIGQQVKNAIRAGLVDLTHKYEWDWLKTRTSAVSWVTETAQLGSNIQEVRGVAWSNGNVLIALPYADESIFDSYPVTGYTAAEAYRPLIWTRATGDHTQVRVKPYPEDVTAQDTLYFYVTRTVDMPATDSDVFAIPESFIPALELISSASFALHNREEDGLFSRFYQLYIEMVKQLAQRHTNAPGHAPNMYKRRGSYGRDFY